LSFFGTNAPPPFDREYIHAESELTILCMDSRGGDYGSGQLSESQLEWLKEKLAVKRDTLLIVPFYISDKNLFFIYD